MPPALQDKKHTRHLSFLSFNASQKMSLDSFKPAFAAAFPKCVAGYHMLNTAPIKEGVWEEINTQIFSATGCAVTSTASGGHASGADIVCALGSLSNKSVQYADAAGSRFEISSYRLTTVCSDAKPGDPAAIIAEIKRRDNFDYYSIIARNKAGTAYDWYLIPKSVAALDAGAYTWEPMLGSRGANAGKQVGWRTNTIDGCSMTITFSMSSQLWIKCGSLDAFKPYVVASAPVPVCKKMTYIELAELLAAKTS